MNLCRVPLLYLLMMLTSPAFAGDPRPIADPEKYSDEIVGDIAQNRVSDVATKISEPIGLSEQKATIENTLKFMADKKFEFHQKVLDRQFADALRQMIYYTYIKDIGFVYFRFNYKKTGAGWVLAHFTFASEVNELFPPSMNVE